MRQHSMRLGAIAVVILGIFYYLPTVYAQCPNDGSGEAIQCRVGNLLNKNATLLGTMSKYSQCDPTDAHCSLLKTHLQRAQKAQARANRAHGNTSADDYHQLTLKGNYHRKSNRNGGGNSNSVDTVDTTYDTTSNNATTATSESTGQSISDSLDDASSALDDANTLASSNDSSTHTFYPLTAYNYETDEAYPNWLHEGIDEKKWIPALFGLKVAAKALEIANVGAEHACLETLVVIGEGGNGSLACLALALTVATVEYEVSWMEYVDSDKLYWNAHGSYVNAAMSIDLIDQTGKNSKDAANGIGWVQDYITNTLNPDINEIKGSLKKLHDEVLTNQALLRETLKLLLTPDGKKILDPGITTCVGANCPNVLSQCSSVPCAFPIK